MKRIVLAIPSLIIPLCVSSHGLVSGSLPGASRAQDSRTDHYITDPVLHRRWAVVLDRDHPERPWTLKEVPWQDASHTIVARQTKSTAPLGRMPMIPAGAKVRLWLNADGATIELVGIALDAGVAGQTIHVRAGSRGAVLEGKVRGAGSVELSTSGKWQNKLAYGWTQ